MASLATPLGEGATPLSGHLLATGYTTPGGGAPRPHWEPLSGQRASGHPLGCAYTWPKGGPTFHPSPA